MKLKDIIKLIHFGEYIVVTNWETEDTLYYGARNDIYGKKQHAKYLECYVQALTTDGGCVSIAIEI
jgi:hypothetical protein